MFNETSKTIQTTNTADFGGGHRDGSGFFNVWKECSRKYTKGMVFLNFFPPPKIVPQKIVNRSMNSLSGPHIPPKQRPDSSEIAEFITYMNFVNQICYNILKAYLGLT